MPVYNGSIFEVNEAEMKRYAGMPPKSEAIPASEIRSAANEARALTEPRGIWQIYSYLPESGTILGTPPMTLQGSHIRRHLSKSYSVAVFAVTAGDAIGQASDEHFAKGEYTRGLLLAGAAAAITEQLADQVNDLIRREAARSGQKTAWRYSPGYGDWPVTQQAELVRLIGAEQIGVSVNSHSMLMPRKTVTAIIGLSACAQAPAPKRCSQCSLRNCPFRSR